MTNRYTKGLLLTSILLFSQTLFAQQNNFTIKLNNGSFLPSANANQFSAKDFDASHAKFANKQFCAIQLWNTPTVAQRAALANAGIVLQQYMGDFSYTATIERNLQGINLMALNLRSIFDLPINLKMASSLLNNNPPLWSRVVNSKTDVTVSLSNAIDFNEQLNALKQAGAEILQTNLLQYGIVQVRMDNQQMEKLAALPFVQYVEPILPNDRKVNNDSRNISRGNIVNAPTTVGGKNLNGKGVVIGIGDDADVRSHIDLVDRVINHAATGFNYHGTHVSGTAAGAGIIREIFRGYGSKSTIIDQYFSGIWQYADQYVADYGMVITNNSYGSVLGDCGYAGKYDAYSRTLDLEAYSLPSLLNVFAAGNDGPYNNAIGCPPYVPGFATVAGSYQSAKNVLTVAMMDNDMGVSPISSRGPVKDGRIKPEIAAVGGEVGSTAPFNSFSNDWGTSMACPGVAGGSILLYERYKQLNGGANPKSDLVKALLMNGANDYGNDGPDFKFGFGSMNILRSIELLEQNKFSLGNIVQGAINNSTFVVPANTAQLKVMLYWHDPAAAPFASKTLVNDLDLEVLVNGTTLVLPRILDTAAVNVNNVATSGADHMNNVEQVTINNAPAGTYTIRVKGTSIAQNPSQDYVLVFNDLQTGIRLTHPGYDPVTPGENLLITWDANGNTSNTFALSYSVDNGNIWIDVDNNIPANLRQYTWAIPTTVTDQAKFRLTRNGTGESSISPAFVVLDLPAFNFTADQCEGYIKIAWPAVAGATAYEVMMKKADSMASVAIIPATNYTFAGLNSNTEYWVTVRSVINGKVGRRANARPRTPNVVNCSGNISDNDLKLDAILGLNSGRLLTSTQIAAGSTMRVNVKNVDDQPANSFKIKYNINGGAFVENAINTPLAANTIYTHTFSGLNLSAVGTYNIMVIVQNDIADPNPFNDTLRTTVKQIDNQPITLPFTENFDAAPKQTQTNFTFGLASLDRFDFNNSNSIGRIRTYTNIGNSFSGQRAITMDLSQAAQGGSANSLTGTYNLANYNTSQDLRFDFRFKHHNNNVNTGNFNKVQIRGNDGAAWIDAYDLFANQIYKGQWKPSQSIELSDLLQAAGQTFTTSTQIQIGQWGQYAMGDNLRNAGYTYDDFRLYIANDDIQMMRIESPIFSSCGLNGNSTLQVKVRNSMNSVRTNIPVKARVDGGGVISETIASINANDSITYSFATPFDLSAIGEHNIDVWVDMPNDNVRINDSINSFKIFNSPLISSYPYLQNFESTNGACYTNGRLSTWQYGTPSSTVINRAASGTKAWKTNINGNYEDEEESYFYTPCFNVSGLTNPTLSFSVAMDLEQCPVNQGGPCDQAWIEYSTDGKVWTKLGAAGQGTNWYNQTQENTWDTTGHTNWHVASIPLPSSSSLRLRIALKTDPGVNREGVAIDDIHVFDNVNPIYETAPSSPAVTTVVDGTTNKIDFVSNGKLIATILPNGQNLGSTTVQAYINTLPVRDTNNQYYHDRNISIKPTNVNLQDSVTIRFYYLENETNRLLQATNCGTCTKPRDAYRFGVTKYDDANDAIENGTLRDNLTGQYSFINNSNVKVVPYDKGYYIEFKVKNFSEFWLNNGGINNSQALPLNLLSFTANKIADNDVQVDWQMLTDENIQFEVQVAKGNAALQNGAFISLGSVNGQRSNAVQRYRFVDRELGKTGLRFYRLRMMNADGKIAYSKIKYVNFDGKYDWQIYPNPVSKNLQVIVQAEANEQFTLKLLNAQGQLLMQQNHSATGNTQKISLDLSSFASGVYMLHVFTNNQQQTFKVNKQ